MRLILFNGNSTIAILTAQNLTEVVIIKHLLIGSKTIIRHRILIFLGRNSQPGARNVSKILTFAQTIQDEIKIIKKPHYKLFPP